MTDGDGVGFSKAALLSTPFWIYCMFLCTFLPFFSLFLHVRNKFISVGFNSKCFNLFQIYFFQIWTELFREPIDRSANRKTAADTFNM